MICLVHTIWKMMIEGNCVLNMVVEEYGPLKRTTMVEIKKQNIEQMILIVAQIKPKRLNRQSISGTKTRTVIPL